MEWGFCDQMCQNTIGSYRCSCYSFFDMIDNKTCVNKKSSPPYSVYFAHDKSILKMDSHGQNQQLVANGSSVSGLDYHWRKNMLFWIDVKTKKVRIATK